MSGSLERTRRRRREGLDVVVVGGGMAGAAAALALADEGCEVALVEAREPEPWRAEDEVDLRVVALAASSAQLLDRLGVWDDILAARACGYRHMHVWDAENGAVLDFDAADLQRRDLGWIVENRLIQQCLWQALDAADVRRHCPASVERYTADADGVRVHLDDERVLDARLLVAADGARSPLRAQAGIATRGRDYQQRGVVAHVRTEREHGYTAWQRFLPEGPIALLPLADGRCSIVWTLPEARAREVLALDDKAFRDAVGVATDFRLGPILETTARAGFPLRLQLAERYADARLVLLGDAAHAVHPLAGQGVNLGLRDVVELRDTIRDARAADRDIGSAAVLRRYARRRRSADTFDARAFDGVERLFGVQWSPFVTARGVGMRMLNRMGFAKRLLAGHAAGTLEPNPK
ncbi:UbiH/UbiF/VisC/COQ6 family ubiquinone biosynthesis hydroxylase [Oleiagrimonas soli]|uniref:2-octaprenyl-3-methyl-6-methoxy-1,4-benzoquinol hydroxylase n=1 Tax=Oleiagrimonas soli TaxID=1543381 RepID=A0A099CSX7_9GAMM|nr:UbiH/UbiF/VisC/COQ6 family ubiquinone biosynthesis hydroxylase [Oleiagrimonas soli]KGI77043.1 2-octaprenyl-3-methyl-6-methoxy-1,4-benzoquinol hydroxylase [Oleiagrimonas soli]MBB6185433.1 2-octaprenyl-3-methyl-6-methoxy-1,4-benzoquinol hydroxylase/2-octaprenylphenol hydroxylase [Oleiagrimonas soli]